MEFWPFILSFLGIYLILGRKAAVPYGLLILNNIFLLILITFILDFLQILFYYFIFSILTEKIKPIKRFRKKQEKRIKKHRAWKLAQRYGNFGIFILAALPSFGGGVWSAVLLGFGLKINKKLMFVLISLGSLTGIMILAFSAQGIIALIH